MLTLLKIRSHLQSPGYCGPCSLRMAMDYFGVQVTERALARASGATRTHGVGVEGLKRASEQYGFTFHQKDRASFADIRAWLNKGIPVIVDWFSVNDGHYSVVAGMDRTHISIQDPEDGKLKRITQEEFKRVWFDFPGAYIKHPSDLILRRMIVIYPSKRK